MKVFEAVRIVLPNKAFGKQHSFSKSIHLIAYFNLLKFEDVLAMEFQIHF